MSTKIKPAPVDKSKSKEEPEFQSPRGHGGHQDTREEPQGTVDPEKTPEQADGVKHMDDRE